MHTAKFSFTLKKITGPQFLTKSKTHKRKFQRGKTDEFDLQTFELGNITKIK